MALGHEPSAGQSSTVDETRPLHSLGLAGWQTGVNECNGDLSPVTSLWANNLRSTIVLTAAPAERIVLVYLAIQLTRVFRV
jgi:hypothetical protein